MTIQANNDITVNAALNMSQSLTLQAGRSVLLNQNITLTGGALTIIANDDAGIDAQRDTGVAQHHRGERRDAHCGDGAITLTLERGDAGAAGGITVDAVRTTGTLTIETAGFVRETAGDAAATAGAMTSDDDLTAGVLNLVALATDATFGEPSDQGNGALEIAAGVLNANVQLAGGAPASDFIGRFILSDVDHTNGAAGLPPATTNAPLTIGTIQAGGGTVVLTAIGGSILGTAGATPNITAGQINLTTQVATTFGTAYFGGIGTAGAPLRTDVAAITATSARRHLHFRSERRDDEQDHRARPRRERADRRQRRRDRPQADGSTQAGTSDVTISAGGDVILVEAQVADQFTLNTTGKISDGNQEATNVLARGLTISAGGAIGDAAEALETNVMQLSATATSGGIFVAESDNISVGTITAGGAAPVVRLTSSAGSITLGAISAPSGQVTLTAGAGSITDGNGATANITADGATLEARNGLGTSGDALEVNAPALSTKVTQSGAGTFVANAAAPRSLTIETNNGAVAITLSGGSLALVQPGSANRLSLTAPGITSFTFSNTGGSLALESINAGTGAVSLTAMTGIEDHATDTVLDLTGGAVTLTAGTTIGTAANPIETNLDTLTAAAAAGGVFIADSGAITSLTATARGAGNDVAVSTVGNLGVAHVVAPDAVTLSAGGAGNLTRVGTSPNVSSASATLAAGGAIGTAAEPLLLGTATITSAVANGGGVFLRTQGAVTATLVRATGGDIALAGTGNLTVGLIETGAANAVSITSTGAIVDGNGAALNVRGGTGTLIASAIGTSGDALDTELATLTATGSSGGVFIKELDALTVPLIEARGLGSEVSLTTGGNLILSVAKAEGDTVSITAGGSIADGNGSALNITADLLNINGAGGVATLQNSINRLGSASGGAGGITLANVGAIALTEATLQGRGASLLTMQAASITVLDMADNVAQLDSGGSLRLISETGNIVFLDRNDTIATSGTGTITMLAGLGLTSTYPDTGAVIAIGNLTTTGGAIEVRANHHITIGSLDTGGAGNVTVASETGIIIDGNGAARNIIGAVVTLSGVQSTLRGRDAGDLDSHRRLRGLPRPGGGDADDRQCARGRHRDHGGAEGCRGGCQLHGKQRARECAVRVRRCRRFGIDGGRFRVRFGHRDSRPHGGRGWLRHRRRRGAGRAVHRGWRPRDDRRGRHGRGRRFRRAGVRREYDRWRPAGHRRRKSERSLGGKGDQHGARRHCHGLA